MRLWTVAMSSALCTFSLAQAEEYSKSYTVSGRAYVHVHVDDSRVRVVTAESHDVAFTVAREGANQSPSGQGRSFGHGLKMDSHQDHDRIEISVVHEPGVVLGYSNERLITEVHMPRDADLQIESQDGSVELASVNGKVTVKSIDGAIMADGVKGEAHLHSTDGAVTVTHLDGQCDVSSTDGALRAEGRFDSLQLVTTDGSVVAKIGAGSKMTSAWSIRSVDGSLDVSLPRGFQTNINASTQDGRIKLGVPVTSQDEISHSKVRGTLNGGGPELTLKSTDGSIRIDEI